MVFQTPQYIIFPTVYSMIGPFFDTTSAPIPWTIDIVSNLLKSLKKLKEIAAKRLQIAKLNSCEKFDFFKFAKINSPMYWD